MVAMVLIEIFPNNKRRSHVNEGGAHAVQQAVGEEHPLYVAHEGRAETGDSQNHCADDAA